MRNLTPEFQAELDKEHLTLARLWKITPRYGKPPLYFTDHDADLVVGGQLYNHRHSFDATAIEMVLGSGMSNLDLAISTNEDFIDARDLRAGVYDNASMTIEMVSWSNLAAGSVLLFQGELSESHLPNDMTATLTVRPISLKNKANLGEFYSPTCRAVFGDNRCKFNLETVQEAFTVGAVASRTTFTGTGLVAPAGAYDLGTVVWLTGENAGTAQEVASFAQPGGVIRLFARPRFSIEAGDTGKVYQGCNKTVAMCTAYNNTINYRGEPNVPGDNYR